MSVINIGGCPPTSLESKSIVPRHRLLSLLNEGTKYPLTLCVASSGWGKGTLLTSWANHTDKHVSWLQVDESDNEVAMFYQKLASSLLAMLSKQDYQSDPPPGASSLDLAWTLEQVSHITGDHVLILNDYHLVSNPEVHEAVIALIRWAPPSLHLIISSESTPPFPLSSFRAHSQLFEISALDLAFTRGDLRLLLRENLIDLKETSVERLMDLTGGWPAALHLALLQIKRIDPEDRDDFVSNIGARDRRITEWLNDAIYDTLPSRIRTFMLDTCILNEFSAPLCDTVRSTDDSGEYIVWLKDRGLISPVDDQGTTFAYPKLLRAFLRDQFSRTSDLAHEKDLWQKAAAWYQKRGELLLAAEYHMASGDTTAGWLLLDRYHSHALESAPSISPQKTRLTWYREFLSWPDSVLAQEPDLCLSAAFSSYYSKDLDHIERPLRLAEQAFLARDDKPALGRAHAIRSLVYRYRGSADLAIDEGKHALDNLPTDLNWFRGSALLSQSFGFYLNGDAGSSAQCAAEARSEFVKAHDNRHAAIAETQHIEVLLLQGSLIEAEERSLALLELQSNALDAERRLARAILGFIAFERNHLNEAEVHSNTALYPSPNAQKGKYLPFAYIGLAEVAAARSDIDTSLMLLNEAEQYAAPRPERNWSAYIQGVKAKVLLEQGDHSEAAKVLYPQGSIVETPFQGTTSFMSFIIAQRTLLAFALEDANRQDIMNMAKRQLERSLVLFDANSAAIWCLSARALLGCIYFKLGQREQALRSIEYSLALAEKEQIVRSVIAAGDILKPLLELAVAQDVHPAYAQSLIHALECRPKRSKADTDEALPVLSEREVEILEMIARGSTTETISQQLYISVHTVRTHIRNTLQKLDAHSRVEAVENARERGILPR